MVKSVKVLPKLAASAAITITLVLATCWLVSLYTGVFEVGAGAWSIAGAYVGISGLRLSSSSNHVALRLIWVISGGVVFGIVGYLVETPPYSLLNQVMRAAIFSGMFGLVLGDIKNRQTNASEAEQGRIDDSGAP